MRGGNSCDGRSRYGSVNPWLRRFDDRHWCRLRNFLHHFLLHRRGFHWLRGLRLPRNDRGCFNRSCPIALHNIQLLRHEKWNHHQGCYSNYLQSKTSAEKIPTRLSLWKERFVEDSSICDACHYNHQIPYEEIRMRRDRQTDDYSLVLERRAGKNRTRVLFYPQSC